MPLPPLPELVDRLRHALPGVRVEVQPNPAVAAEESLVVDPADARAVALWLRDTPGLLLDQCSNVTGVDWPDAGDGGFLEVVYHLFSITLRHGPVILRQRTAGRAAGVSVDSLTPVWRACEFQEREVFDLFGVGFRGHPDLRRLLMWDGFEDHPMRRDYVEPDDFEYEPTPHDAVMDRAQRHYPAGGGAS